VLGWDLVRAVWRKYLKRNYTVVVSDNSHYMDEEEQHEAGSFATREAALRAAKAIVDEYLVSAYKPGMTAADLFRSYTSFGEDPFIDSAEDAEDVDFSAWDYARQRCEDLCRAADRSRG
jgi:hypothetical protein